MIHYCPRCQRSVKTSKLYFTCVCIGTTKATNNLWLPLHQYASDHSHDWSPIAAAEYYHRWSATIPNLGCGSCRVNWDAYVTDNPPDFTSAPAFFCWGVTAHNHVNTYHVADHRTVLSLREAAQLYGFPELQIDWQRKTIPTDPRVAFLAVTYLKIGGTETFHQSLLPRLPSVIGLGVTNRCEGNASKLGVPIKCPKELAIRADVLVVWGIDRLADYLPNPRPKIIATHHADWSSDWSNRCVLDQLDVIDEIVCVHPEVANKFREMTNKPVHFIPNCIDTDRVTPTTDAKHLRQKWGIPTANHIIFFCHRLSHEKQPLLAIETAKLLPDDYTLVIAGSGPMEDACKAAAEHVPNVRLVGDVASPADWLSQSNCFISLSTFEGFGLSIGEAMLAGVPVLSTPTGIALIPGLCSTLAATSSAQQWAEGIVSLVESDTADQTFAAQQHCQKHWGIDRFVSHWQSILNGT